jgi:hypothetical protein
MNTIQKRILAIFVPILVFAVVYGIAGTALDKKCPSEEKIGALTLCDRYKLINAQKFQKDMMLKKSTPSISKKPISFGG